MQRIFWRANQFRRKILAFIISEILIIMKQVALKAIRKRRNPLMLETKIEWKVTVALDQY